MRLAAPDLFALACVQAYPVGLDRIEPTSRKPVLDSSGRPFARG